MTLLIKCSALQKKLYCGLRVGISRGERLLFVSLAPFCGKFLSYLCDLTSLRETFLCQLPAEGFLTFPHFSVFSFAPSASLREVNLYSRKVNSAMIGGQRMRTKGRGM